MTAIDKERVADTVGYRQPPKASQFRKGQSGNPRGRPPKQPIRPVLAPPPAQFPTRETLRAEAARTIILNDASGRQAVTIREAVTRALALAAMRGGVFAQRALLDMLNQEDERYHRERQASFDFWLDYQRRCQAIIAAVCKAGREVPDLVPHPDDIVFNWRTLDVTFLGAMDDDGRAREKMAAAFQDLGYEMAVYADEDNQLPGKNGEDGRLGAYLGLYLVGYAYLPPRLRREAGSYDDEIRSRMLHGLQAWGDDLERRCKTARVPFRRYRAGMRAPSRPFAELGFQWGDGGIRLKAPHKKTR